MNKVTLAVAGGRKTQSIVDACSSVNPKPRRLVVTYTLSSQKDVERRLNQSCKPGMVPEVSGWYSFLLNHWIRPYLAAFLPGQRLHGFNFHGESPKGRYAKGVERYLDANGYAYRIHLSKLAIEVAKASNGAVIDRLERIYHEIYIDEVQDMSGCDLYIFDELLKSKIDVHMVGDLRQSVFDTNPRDRNLTQYRGVKMINWFTEREARKKFAINRADVTWRSNKIIASFSDKIFNPDHRLGATVSRQIQRTGHDGVFVIAAKDGLKYFETFSPLCLRSSIAVAKEIDLPFRNFGVVKGLTVDRVLIYPTAPIEQFLSKGTLLKDQPACGLYVAVTRAKHSVAFVVRNPSSIDLPQWTPETTHS